MHDCLARNYAGLNLAYAEGFLKTLSNVSELKKVNYRVPKQR